METPEHYPIPKYGKEVKIKEPKAESKFCICRDPVNHTQLEIDFCLVCCKPIKV